MSKVTFDYSKATSFISEECLSNVSSMVSIIS